MTNPSDWKITFGLAQALGNNKQHQDAVETLEKLIKDNADRISNDEDFKDKYWNNMLLLIGYWNIEQKNFAAAELAYKKLLDEAMTRETFETFARKAALVMTSVFNEQSKHQDTVDLLLSLEARPDQEKGNWLFTLLCFYLGTDDLDLHDRIFTAAHNVDQLGVVTEKYRAIVEKLRSDESEIGAYLHLRYWLAASLWSHQCREEKETALETWEENLNMELPEGAEDGPLVSYARFLSALKLAVALLDSAKEAGLSKPMSPAAEAYARRLERLSHGNPEYVRDTTRDIRISLARLHHLAGDDGRAKDLLLEILRTGLQTFMEHRSERSETFKNGLYRVAIVLQAMDDDVNAIAAWRCFTPTRSVDEENSSDGEEADADEEDADDEEEKVSAENKVQSAENETSAPKDEQAVAGAEQEDVATQDIPPDGEATANGKESHESPKVDTEAESQASEKPDEIPPGVLGSSCDGLCGYEWTYVDDLYSCKDCLDLQLNPSCYAKLQAGTLNPKVCDKRHSHIYLPPFDRVKWEALAEDEMWVGDEVVKVEQWVESIRREWGIDEGSLKAREKLVRATMKIQRAWRLFKPPGGE